MMGLSKLHQTHPALIAVLFTGVRAYEVASGKQVRFTEGIRSPERQRRLYAEGKTKTLRSYHLVGRAVDLAIVEATGDVLWRFNDYRDLNEYIQDAALDLGEIVTWGGDWPSADGVHFQIERPTLDVSLT